MSICIWNKYGPIVPGEMVVLTMLKISDGGPHVGHVVLLLSLHITSFTERVLVNQEAMQRERQNNMAYVCSSIRYLRRCEDYNFSRHDWHVPVPDAYGRPLFPTGPPFDPWMAPQDASMAYQLVVEHEEDVDKEEDA